MAIDASQVQWDDTPTTGGSIDPSKVQWDDESPIHGVSSLQDAANMQSRAQGLIDRAGLKGVGMVADIPEHLISGTDYVGKTIADAVRHLFGAKSSTPAVSLGSPAETLANTASNTLGLPTPQGQGEQTASDIATGMVGGALTGGEAPMAGALSGASSVLSGKAAQASGAGPVGQTVASIAGGIGPAALAATTRGIVRGGSQGAANMQQNLENAANSGNKLSLGQASDNSVLQSTERASSYLPGGGAIRDLQKTQQAGQQSKIEEIVDNLTGQTNKPTSQGTGTAIETGAANTKVSMKSAENAAYLKQDSLIPPDIQVSVPTTSSTLEKLIKPNSDFGDILANPTIKKIYDKWQEVTAPTPSPTPDPLIRDFNAVQSQPASMGGGTVRYQDLRELRSMIGDSIDWSSTKASDPQNGALKQLYGALGKDIQAGARAVSPEAGNAAFQANSLYKANSVLREQLNMVVDKAGGPEATYAAATGNLKGGDTKVGAVMGALNPQQQNLFRGTVLHQMGLNAKGDFDASTFLKKWADKNFSPQAKDALFGASGPPNDLRRGLDAITGHMQMLDRQGSLKPANAAGVAAGHALGLGAVLAGIWEHGAALVTGHPAVTAGAIGAVALNTAFAKAVTNPNVVKILARPTNWNAGALPNVLAQLNQSPDPDAKALATAIKGVQ